MPHDRPQPTPPADRDVFVWIFKVLLELIQRDRVEVAELSQLIRQLGVTMSEELDRLTTEVSEQRTVVDSAITLLGQLAQLIRDNVTDPAALTALADDLDNQQNDLASAVAANTPATPPTP